jgi:hypothetical protein
MPDDPDDVDDVLAELCPVQDLPSYYRQVVQHFSNTGSEELIARFCKLAIEATTGAAEEAGQDWTKDSSIRVLSYKLFQSLTSLGEYDEAYTTLMAMPYLDMFVDFFLMQ